ncbi:MAG: RNA 2',3'-cyclic phosphodiesterase [Methanosarcinales archaeon]|jgi:2'-5' RNA ligase|nr:RNA 2',3'-cyclic phosphodiesterase [Methanosarcinales archaeon]
MRLFIAADFDNETKDKMSEIIEILKSKSKGNFTRYENLHMTLVFIGETEKAKEIKEAVQEALEVPISKPPVLTLDHAGRFKRGNTSLIWIGGEACIFDVIQKRLAEKLISKGLEIDRKKFVPHITLGRQVYFSKDFKSEKEIDRYLESIPVYITENIKAVSLMSSVYRDNKLVYEEIGRFQIRFE